jgi:hypothetical protein
MTRKIAFLMVCMGVASIAQALTPTPTLTDGACGPGLAASVVAGPTPVVYVTGNLNAGTPLWCVTKPCPEVLA